MNPTNVPWPQWATWLALAISFAAFAVWFSLVAWATSHVQPLGNLLVRVAAYAVLVWLASYASLILMLPAFAIFGTCNLISSCGAAAQGVINTLYSVALNLKSLYAGAIALLLVAGVAIGTSSRHSKKTVRPSSKKGDA